VTSGGRIIFWCETYIRDDATATTTAAAAAATSTNATSKSNGEATAATKGDTKPGATTENKNKKKRKEYMRLCWSELWFEEAAKAVSAAGPAKPPSYHAHGATARSSATPKSSLVSDFALF
jgi:hypothetical protein